MISTDSPGFKNVILLSRENLRELKSIKDFISLKYHFVTNTSQEEECKFQEGLFYSKEVF
jgi:hypothetical protein